MQHRSEPITVEVRRGGFVESTHQVHAVVATADQVLSTWGDSERLTMPRSAIKSIQVLPMLALGAAAAFDVSDDEVALASASHSAEQAPHHCGCCMARPTRPGHRRTRVWAERSDQPRCSRRRCMREPRAPTPLHNCCSGKHSGFLTLARYLARRSRVCACPVISTPIMACRPGCEMRRL